jgi:hypothetical protein
MSRSLIYRASFAAMAALAVPAAFTSVAVLGASPALPGEVAACLQLAAFVALLLAPVAFRPPGAALTSPQVLKSICTLWLWISGLTHVTWELSWCIVHPYLHAVDGHSTWAWVWWIYGVADHRFLRSDSFVVAREWMASVVEGPLNLWILHLFRKRRTLDACRWLMIVSTMEITGTALYFGSEAFNGFANIDAGLVNFWIKFVALTWLWIVVPALVLYNAAKMLAGLLAAAGPAVPAMGAAAEAAARVRPEVPALGWAARP